jgi:hypothetical protein
MPSPIAVDSCNCSRSIAVLTWPWSFVGDTTTVALLANDTSERLNDRGNSSTNSFAASLAAVNRSGSMSVACIDSDTSMASTMVARSSGSFTSVAGLAMPTESVSRHSTNALAATCRRQPGLLGAMDCSSAMLVKRTA